MSERSKSTWRAMLGLKQSGETARKTVTFGDASAVVGSRTIGVLTILILLLLWYVSSVGGWTNPVFWPTPMAVWGQFVTIATDGFKQFTLLEHIGWSLRRIMVGFALGCLVGIPLGFAMGLSNVLRGMFDPIVEFCRPIPPIALIPLIIIWSGIGEDSKTILLFLAALWIMAIAARSGVASVRISKVHAAYSLGASKRQLLFHVILPNSLPEIFIGMRVAMGVCWGTVVAAELIAAESGVGFMIMAASRFMSTDIVMMGIIVIGIIGYGIDVIMRVIESRLIPWKGRG